MEVLEMHTQVIEDAEQAVVVADRAVIEAAAVDAEAALVDVEAQVELQKRILRRLLSTPEEERCTGKQFRVERGFERLQEASGAYDEAVITAATARKNLEDYRAEHEALRAIEAVSI